MTSTKKICTKCRIAKPRLGFHKDRKRWDGLQPWCIDCYREWTKSPSGKKSNYKKGMKYQRTPKGHKKIRKLARKYRQTENYKQTSKRYKEKYRERDRLKRRANAAIHNEVAQSRMTPVINLKCSWCEKQASHYHHHKGYDEIYKLDVIPLCVSCHRTTYGQQSQYRLLTHSAQRAAK